MPYQETGKFDLDGRKMLEIIKRDKIEVTLPFIATNFKYNNTEYDTITFKMKDGKKYRRNWLFRNLQEI